MKKVIKVFNLAIVAFLILSIGCKNLAITPTEFQPVDFSGSDRITNAGSNVVSMIVGIGTFVSLGVMIAIGIKYMLGSAEQKAEYKKVMLPYLVGCILLFGASWLTHLIYNLMSN